MSVSLLFLLNIELAVAATADSCNACHGDAVRAATKAPPLAGQSVSYLKKQLLQFQNGERGALAADVLGQQMAVMAKTLSSTDIDQLATFFSAQITAADSSATQPSTEAPPGREAQSNVTPAQLDQGRRLYIGSCGACHGATAEGNPALHAPALKLLPIDYLILQLQHFRGGLRGITKTDKPGRQMALMTRTLTDADIEAVAAYIGAGL